jgi:hypothetical protein
VAVTGPVEAVIAPAGVAIAVADMGEAIAAVAATTAAERTRGDRAQREAFLIVAPSTVGL